MSKKFQIPVTFEVSGMLEIEAETLEEAVHEMKYSRYTDGAEFELPTEFKYEGASLRMTDDYSIQDLQQLFNPRTE